MDRSVVVTGAGQGIGRACLDRLLADGWFVVGIEVDEELAAQVEAAAAGRGAVVRGDVAERSTHLDGAALAREHAPLAGWVNNAGIGTRGTLHRPDVDAIRRVLDVNLGGTMWGCAAAAAAFVEQRSGGAIVNISSIHGRRSFANHAAYDTSKGGVDALTRNLAVEYGPIGVRVNAVAPGGIRTPLLQRGHRGEPRPGRSASHARVVPAAAPSRGADRDRRRRRLPALRAGVVRQRAVDRRRRCLDRNARAAVAARSRPCRAIRV